MPSKSRRLGGRLGSATPAARAPEALVLVAQEPPESTEPPRRTAAIALSPPAKAALLASIQELEVATGLRPKSGTPDLFAFQDPSLIHAVGILRIAKALQQPRMKARSRGAPQVAASSSVQTDLRTMPAILAILQFGSAKSASLQSLLKNLSEGIKPIGQLAEWAARFVFKNALISELPLREKRRHHKMLSLLLEANLPPLSELSPQGQTERAVIHHTPLCVMRNAPAMPADTVPAVLRFCDMRGLGDQIINDFVAPVSAIYDAGSQLKPNDCFQSLLLSAMTEYTEYCERALKSWLTDSVIFPNREVLYCILTLILLRGTNYSVTLKGKLIWNKNLECFELRSRKPRAGYIPIRLKLTEGVLTDSLVRLRKIRKNSTDLLSIWDGSTWSNISPTDYTSWLNSILPPHLLRTRTLPSQFRTTLAQTTALQDGQGIQSAKDILDHQSLRQTVDYVDSPFFRLKQDTNAVVIMRKIDALAVSGLDAGTIGRLGLDMMSVEKELQQIAADLELPMPATCDVPLLQASVTPPSPVCDRRRRLGDGMPLAPAGETAALLGRAAHFATHNMSMIIESAQSPGCDEHSAVQISVLAPCSALSEEKTVKVHEAMALLCTSVKIILTFSGLDDSEQAEALQATPFHEAGAWRVKFGKVQYVRPISGLAAAIITAFGVCQKVTATPTPKDLIQLPAVSPRTILQLLHIYGLTTHWHQEIGHAKNRCLFTPARLLHGLAYLWWVVTDGELSAFAYQIGDHGFSKIERLVPRITRAWFADPAGPYARKIVPRLAQIITMAPPLQAANENLMPAQIHEVRRKRIPMHEHGVDRALQLEVRIKLLHRIAEGSLVDDSLPCRTIQGVLCWDYQAEQVVPLITKSLTTKHELHGHQIKQIKLLLGRIRKSAGPLSVARTSVQMANPSTLPISPFNNVMVRKTPPGSGARPTALSHNIANIVAEFAHGDRPKAARQFPFRNSFARLGFKRSNATDACIVDDPMSLEKLESALEASAAKTPPGSSTSTSLTFGRRR